MKIFINNRNWLTWPSGMAKKFAEEGHEVIFIDNASTYEPLLDYYSTCGHQVLRMPNYGNVCAWTANIVTGLDEFYVVTDPDYDLSEVPHDWEPVLMDGFRQFPHLNKMGISWDESRVPPENPAFYIDNMYLYPQGNPIAWGNILPNNWYNYANDTSFAIYRPHRPFRIDGIRKGRPYTGMHMPWHIVLEDKPSSRPGAIIVPFNDEIEYYFDHVENSSFTAGRLAGMLADYKKRKANATRI